MPLITLDQVKTHLRYTGTANDVDLQQKMAAAEAAILSYINTTDYWRSITSAWTDATTPADVQHAVLQQVGFLDRFRGDDDQGNARAALDDGGDLSATIVGLLRRWRDPVLA